VKRPHDAQRVRNIQAVNIGGGCSATPRSVLEVIPGTEGRAVARRGEAWAACVREAEQGAEATARMQPRLGRASYLGDRAVGVPDAGAAAVVVWLKALAPCIG
jgi:hypothetical protein